MGKTVWDFASDVMTKHGIAGIMLLAISFMYYDSRTYERAQDKVMAREIAELSVMLDEVGESVERLEDRVFFTIDGKKVKTLAFNKED